jgi:hypothetical protein
MKQITKTGKVKNVKTTPYLVDWDGEQGSKFSEEVLDFLYKYWKNDVVLAEWPVVGTKMRYDYVNLSKKIVCETDGEQHDDPLNFRNRGSSAVWLAQIKRDILKDEIAELNGFKMVRIKPKDLPLTKEFFKQQFDIDL